MSILTNLGDTARGVFVTRRNNGNAVDVNTTSPENPRVTDVWLNGQPNTDIVPVVTQLTDSGSPVLPVTGVYEASFTVDYPGAAAGDRVQLYIFARIQNKDKTLLLDFVVDPATGEPFISVS